MPRRHPSKNIDILGKLDVLPTKAVPEYLASKENEKIFMKTPNFDCAGDEREMLYISEKLEHNNQTKLLKDLQEHKKNQSIISLQRAHKASKDYAELHNRFISVNTFIREFDEKRKIAERKIHKEIKEQSKITNEINLRLEKFDDLKIFRKQLLATANDYGIYESVLNDAVKKTKCPSVEALINRCDAIMFAQDHITRLDAEKFKSIEVMHIRIKEITKQARAIYGALMNELNQCSRSYFNAQQECLRWEHTLQKAQNEIIKNKQQKQFVRDAIEQLYRMLCKRKKVTASLVRVDVAKSLEFIKNEVQLLQEVINEYYNPSIF